VKKIGILGGMAPESTIEYYKIIISLSRNKWEFICPEIIIYNLNMGLWADHVLDPKKHPKAILLLSDGIKSLYRAGADFGIMASNTPHMFFNDVNTTSPIPLLSIVEETAKEAKRRNFKTVGLMGTSIIMEGNFYREPFEKNEISVVTPGEEDRKYTHEKIVTELVRGNFKEETKIELIEIAKRMAIKNNIQALILGCTELPIILNEGNVKIPVLNTMKIHATATFKYAIS